MRARPWLVAALVAVAMALASTACGGDDEGAAPGGSGPSTSAGPAQLRLLVTNDDGFAAPGVDAVVEALRKEPAVEVTVVAPAGDRSGTGGRTTPGELATTEVATASGYKAVSVEGFPADTVNVALDRLGLKPQLVVSGINRGQNIGPITNISGTVGAARAAAARGIPALAVSQGIADPPDYASGANEAVAWVRGHRDRVSRGEKVDGANLNVPTCAAGTRARGLREVRIATDADAQGVNLFSVNCASTVPNPDDDAEAFTNGFATLTPLA